MSIPPGPVRPPFDGRIENVARWIDAVEPAPCAAGRRKTMNITLWVLQVLLAVAFFAHGWLLLMPPPEIAAQMTAQLPRGFWVFLGVAEVLAAAGLTLPGVTRILPWLVPAAAVGVVIVMVSRDDLAPGSSGVRLSGHHPGAAGDGLVHRLRAVADRTDPAEARASLNWTDRQSRSATGPTRAAGWRRSTSPCWRPRVRRKTIARSPRIGCARPVIRPEPPST